MDSGFALFAAAVVCSVASIAFLGWTDPKRRSQRVSSAGRLRVLRTASLFGSILPGLWLLFWHDGGYFLMWFGLVAVVGWIVALVLRQRRLSGRASQG